MMLTVSKITGLPGVPTTQRGLRDWLVRMEVPTVTEGNRFTFLLFDLPPDVQRAYLAREAEALGLEPGSYDEAAHEAMEAASPKMQAKAQARAEVARFIVARDRQFLPRMETFRAVRAKFGSKGNSDKSLFRMMAWLKDVDVANFAPALLDDNNMDGRPVGRSWDEAWHYALARIEAAGPEWPLEAAWEELVEIAPAMGWDVPSRSAFMNRWSQLTAVERFTLRHGREAALRRFRLPVKRDRDDLAPNDIWSLDGRTLDVWAVADGGPMFRPVELRLVDVASGFILAKRICRSENAVDTVALITEAVKLWGIPATIYTDNGRAFASHLVAGGATFKFRKRSTAAGHWEPPGICHHLGINIVFAKPANGQTKLVERSFAETSRRFDQSPELAKAHAGSRIDRKPDGKPVGVQIEDLVAAHDRCMARHNDRKRRDGFAKGRSFAQVYQDGMAGQIKRVATARQLYLASLVYKPVSVDRNGQFQVEGHTFGQPETMPALLQFFDVERGRAKDQILVGIDPADFTQPAIAFDRTGREIARDIKVVKVGKYMSAEGKRDHQRFDKAARDLTGEAAKLAKQASKALIAKGNAAFVAATPPTAPATGSGVVQGRFNPPLNGRSGQAGAAVPQEYWDNLDAWLGMPKSSAS